MDSLTEFLRNFDLKLYFSACFSDFFYHERHLNRFSIQEVVSPIYYFQSICCWIIPENDKRYSLDQLKNLYEEYLFSLNSHYYTKYEKPIFYFFRDFLDCRQMKPIIGPVIDVCFGYQINQEILYSLENINLFLSEISPQIVTEENYTTTDFAAAFANLYCDKYINSFNNITNPFPQKWMEKETQYLKTFKVPIVECFYMHYSDLFTWYEFPGYGGPRYTDGRPSGPVPVIGIDDKIESFIKEKIKKSYADLFEETALTEKTSNKFSTSDKREYIYPYEKLRKEVVDYIRGLHTKIRCDKNKRNNKKFDEEMYEEKNILLTQTIWRVTLFDLKDKEVFQQDIFQKDSKLLQDKLAITKEDCKRYSEQLRSYLFNKGSFSYSPIIKFLPFIVYSFLFYDGKKNIQKEIDEFIAFGYSKDADQNQNHIPTYNRFLESVFWGHRQTETINKSYLDSRITAFRYIIDSCYLLVAEFSSNQNDFRKEIDYSTSIALFINSFSPLMVKTDSENRKNKTNKIVFDSTIAELKSVQPALFNFHTYQKKQLSTDSPEFFEYILNELLDNSLLSKDYIWGQYNMLLSNDK